MVDETLTRRILDLVPQQAPFRFIDDILTISMNQVVSSYRFKEDEWFFSGHFPGNPITPGVILVETMAQAGLVVMAIYNYLEQGLSESQIIKKNTLFALMDNVEFSRLVRPGDRVIVKADKIYFKKGNLKTQVSMEHEDGTLICQGILTGKGVENDG
ncbi:MAG: beta-hydroxyacyl-ACP dehydratase [Proteobacteria bacterium]|nr:beta-hydroxyacyl-ACP dehydratase [Pseudomonadota bacterium]